jgi:two-component system sensor histidine kinase KdpD
LQLGKQLASMIGAADTLAMYEIHLPRDEGQQLLQAILHEGQRLDRCIRNLLEMTRPGHGTLKLHCDWVDATENRLRRFFLKTEPGVGYRFLEGADGGSSA